MVAGKKMWQQVKKKIQDFLFKDIVEVNVVVKPIKKRRQPVNEKMSASIVIIERDTKHIVPIGGSYHVSQPESWLMKVNGEQPLEKDEVTKKVKTDVKTELIKFDDGSYGILIRGNREDEKDEE